MVLHSINTSILIIEPSIWWNKASFLHTEKQRDSLGEKQEKSWHNIFKALFDRPTKMRENILIQYFLSSLLQYTVMVVHILINPLFQTVILLENKLAVSKSWTRTNVERVSELCSCQEPVWNTFISDITICMSTMFRSVFWCVVNTFI